STKGNTPCLALNIIRVCFFVAISGKTCIKEWTKGKNNNAINKYRIPASCMATTLCTIDKGMYITENVNRVTRKDVIYNHERPISLLMLILFQQYIFTPPITIVQRYCLQYISMFRGEMQ